VLNFKNFFLLGLLFCLAGCAVKPEDLGISQQKWAKYSESQQQKILDNYKTIVEAKDKEQHSQVTDNWLRVTIQDGLVKMPPFTKRYNYVSVTFRIQDGTCQQVLLHTYNKKHSVNLDCCYKNNVFLLDPSRYEANKADGSIRLYYSPLWQNGFVYKNVSSDGYLYLHNVTVKVQTD
jgi:hypothetical protein